MKLFNRFLTMGLMLLMGMASVACSDSEDVDKPQEVTKVTLSVSPAEIVADGTSAATFKVMTDLDTDVTKDVVITCNDGSTVSGAQFTTATAGTYTFKAAYGKLTSNEVTVTAKETGDAPTPGENKWVTTDVKTPITYAEGNYYGTDTSVGIEVRAAEKGSLRFVCTPGKEVKSYRVQYYSLSWIYNQLINQMNSEGKTELTTEDAENVVRAFMTNDSYEILAGKLMNAENLGGDYASYEFDWFNMDFEKPWPVQADAEYLIVTLASFDEECVSEENFADMAICHVKTPEVALVGDPQVIIDVKASYSNYTITYTANEDCATMYFLSNVASEIDQYIEVYGDNMYRDFLRHYGGSVDLSEPYVSNAGSVTPLPDIDYAATAIALDVNGNPAKVINREDFRLKEKPSEEDRTLGTASITNFKVGARMAQFTVEQDLHSRRVYQQIYPIAEARAIMESEDEQTALINGCVYNGEGWVHPNYNFQFDTEVNAPIGEGAVDTRAFWSELAEETEYAILYFTLNGFGDYSKVQMTESFTTIKRERYKPEMTEDVYFKFTASAPSVTTHRWDVEFDPDKVCQYWVARYEPLIEGDGPYTDPSSGITYEWPNEESDRATWMYWLFDFKDPVYGVPMPFLSAYGPDYPDGKDSTGISDMTPGVTYKYVAVFETWDGYISNTFFSSTAGDEVKFGENPKITDVTYTTEEDGEVVFTFTGNEDVGKIWHVGADPATADGMRLDYLYKKSPAYTKEQYIKYGTNFTIESGLSIVGNHGNHYIDSREFQTNDIYVIVAVPEGAKDGNPVYGEAIYYVWTKELQKFITLDEYFAE